MVVITHRAAVLGAVDRLMLLRDGAIALYGPRDQVLEKLRQPADPAQRAVANSA